MCVTLAMIKLVPWEKGVLFFEGIGDDTRRAKVDDDRTGMNRGEVLGESPVFESRDGAGLRALEGLRTLGHRFVEHCQHFQDRRCFTKKDTTGKVSHTVATKLRTKKTTTIDLNVDYIKKNKNKSS